MFASATLLQPPLLLPAAIAAGSSNGLTNTRCCIVRAPDDGWRYYPKHVEQFPDINKLCKVASYWIHIGIYLPHDARSHER